MSPLLDNTMKDAGKPRKLFF